MSSNLISPAKTICYDCDYPRWETCDITNYNCARCGKPMSGPSGGREHVCKECSVKYDICVYCGKSVKESYAPNKNN